MKLSEFSKPTSTRNRCFPCSVSSAGAIPVASTLGCGVLLVEQHIHLALEIANRGYVLSHGEIVLHDSADVLNADRELLFSSYLGEQQVAIGDTMATAPDSTK